jgi:hypothetical protein
MISIKNRIARHIKNSFGWSTPRKIVVFSADDYGAIRMASKEARDNLRRKGLKIDGNKFDMFDALEDEDDLSELYEVLTSVRDRDGRHAVFTALSISANPNFEKIREDNFENYHFELLTDTWQKLDGYQGVQKLWEYGISNRLLFPQFHGREHLNVKVLMEALSGQDKETLACFENRSYGGISAKRYSTISYVAAFDFHHFSENEYLKQIVKEGLNTFEQVFGFRAKHFASPGAREHHCLEPALHEGGVLYLDSDLLKVEHQGEGKYKRSINHTGKKNIRGQIYLVRNCVFEPGPLDTLDWVGYCLSQIEIAFTWNKPANISTHRVNFAGHIDPLNRRRGLVMLKELLKAIVTKWPDVEFMTTVELGELIRNEPEERSACSRR